MRVTEIQDDSGMVTARISAIEYSDDYYVHPDPTETPNAIPIDLPRLPVIPPIFIPEVYHGDYANVGEIPGNIFGNVVVNEAMKTFGAGAQLTDQPAANTSIVSGTTFLEIIPVESYDITDSDIGDYEFTSAATLGGSPTTSFDVGFSQNVIVTWANATNTASNTFVGGGMELVNVPATSIVPPLRGVRKINLDPIANGHPADMKPQTANIVLRGYTDITEDPANGFPRAFGGLNYQMLRVTKGEKE